MDELKAAQKQKMNVLEQIRALSDMRRGSVTEQFFERKRSDGAITRCGPYHLYTYKQDGQTISRRLPDTASALSWPLRTWPMTAGTPVNSTWVWPATRS